MTDVEAQTNLSDFVDRERILHWALELAEFTNSSHHERPIAEYLYGEYGKLGLRAKVQPIENGRANAIGILEGQGGGCTLMLNGHLDYRDKRTAGELTSVGNAFTTPNVASDEGTDDTPRVVDQHWLRGRGLLNMKSALAAYLGAVDALIRSGVSLNGSVIIAAVAGAERQSAGGDNTRWQQGIGTRHMLNSGVTADMCILGEPTALRTVPGHLGKCLLKLTAATSRHYPVNPVTQIAKVVTELQEWIPTYQNSHQYMGIKPPIDFTSIHSAFPPRHCDALLHIRPIPGQSPLDIQDQIRKQIHQMQVNDTTLNITTELMLADTGHEIGIEAPIFRAVATAHKQVTNSLPEVIVPPWCGDATYLNRHGIPTLIYGPGGQFTENDIDRFGPHLSDYQNVDDLITAAQVYTLAAANICSQPRPCNDER